MSTIPLLFIPPVNAMAPQHAHPGGVPIDRCYYSVSGCDKMGESEIKRNKVRQVARRDSLRARRGLLDPSRT